MTTVVLATRNEHKVHELRPIATYLAASQFGPDPTETPSGGSSG